MAKKVQTWSLGKLARLVGGQLDGEADKAIARPVPAGTCDPLGITFAGDEKFFALAQSQPVGAILTLPDAAKSKIPLIRVENPRQAFGKILALMKRPLPLKRWHPSQRGDLSGGNDRHDRPGRSVCRG